MTLARTEAEDFLYREAELLDAREYEAWLALFADDGVYWLPMDDRADPMVTPSLLYDDRANLAKRVHQLVHRHPFAQRPPSRMVRSVTNVTVTPGASADETVVRSVLMITELREGDYTQLGLGEQRVFAGRCEYRLRGNGAAARIALKKVLLANRDVPIVNLSFIV